MAALVLTPVLRDVFAHYKLLDQPDGDRKTHVKPVPRLGGVPIILSCVAAYALLMFMPMGGGRALMNALPAVWRMVPAVAVVFAVGIVDDIRGLKPWQKLAGEAVACGLAIVGGVQLTGVAGFHLAPWLAIIGTVVWLVGCANAVNLIDGMDGLAAGLALMATCTTFIAALVNGDRGLAFATIPMAGALLGFLRYNYNPASIYLGDSGSLTLGFLLGCYGILWSQKAATLVGMTAPLLLLAVPLVDVALAIARRFLRQQPIFGGDRGHIHHRLLARGLTTRRAVLLLYGVAGLCAWLSLGVGLLHQNYTEIILYVFVLGTLLAIHLLKYVEFRTTWRMLAEGAFRRLLNARIALDAVEEGLNGAKSKAEVWGQIGSAYRRFGFSSLEIRAGDCRYRDETKAEEPSGRHVEFEGAPAETATRHEPGGLVISVNLPRGDRVVLRRDAGMQNHLTMAAAFGEMLGKVLPLKLKELQAELQAETVGAGVEQSSGEDARQCVNCSSVACLNRKAAEAVNEAGSVAGAQPAEGSTGGTAPELNARPSNGVNGKSGAGLNGNAAGARRETGWRGFLTRQITRLTSV